MAQVAANARAFTTGAVWTALFNSTVPTDPTTAYSTPPFYEVGWLSDKGIVESRAISSVDKYAWQNGALIRTLRNQEKRTLTFEALENNATVNKLLLYPTSTFATGSGTNEVQTITSTATGGTFTFTYNGQTTPAQTFNVATATLQTAIQALSTVGSGNLLVTGTAGTTYTLTFSGTLAATNVPSATINGAALTGGTASITTTTQGVPAVTTTSVKPNTSQNLRVFGIDFVDGLVSKRIIILNGEAIPSGSRSYTSGDLTITSFTLTAYPDVNGNIWTEYCNDPALAATVA